MDGRLTRQATTLVVMDVQERLVAAMPDEARSVAVDNVIRLVQGARILDVPTVLTEQYPQGLGTTIEPVSAAIAEGNPALRAIEKLDFDACADTRFVTALANAAEGRAQPNDGPRAVVLCGLETHICIYQTARALVANGYQVHVPFDATCCRNPHNEPVARRLLERAGAIVSITETILFELLGRATGDEFRAINKLVR